MARDFHISAENGMVLSGIVPIYVEVECGIEEPPKVDEDSVMRLQLLKILTRRQST